jgi:hypothetical protein
MHTDRSGLLSITRGLFAEPVFMASGFARPAYAPE